MKAKFTVDAIQRIIVRVPNWVGDAVMCTPALLTLREVFPMASIAVLARPSIADLLRSHPAVDSLVLYDYKGSHSGLGGKLSLIRQLRKEGYDLAILLQNAVEAALLVWLAGIPHRIGYPTDGRGVLLSHSVPLPIHAEMLHQVEYYQRLLMFLTGRDSMYSPTLAVLPDEVKSINEKLNVLGVKEGDVLIGLNPGSVYGGAKRWLPERFAESADRLVESPALQKNHNGSVRCVIVGAPGEEDLGETIAGKMRHRPIVLSGKTTLQGLMALIKRCHLLITNDTGPMHIANAFGVPVVAIFGPTDHTTTSPFIEPYSIVRCPVDCSPCLLRECPIDHRCMTHVTVDEVVRAAEHLVSSSNILHVDSIG